MVEPGFTLNIVPWCPPGVAAIPLRRRDGSVRAWSWVDEQDAAWARSYCWSLSSGYARRRAKGGAVYPRMHRELMGLPAGTQPGISADGREVDHRNGNRLDNRRANLRVVTRQRNLHNMRSKGGGSDHTGVSWDKDREKWKAQVVFSYRNHFLGRFDSEAGAAAAVVAFRESVGMA